MSSKLPTSTDATKAAGVHAMRRGGARREVTERVTLTNPEGGVLEGWALNVSRGGVRAIVEGKVVLGQRFDVAIGIAEVTVRPCRVIWIQEEPDGVIVGLEFVSAGTPESARLASHASCADPGGGASED